jgi:putative transposase
VPFGQSVVDTTGLLLAVEVHAASVQDRDGAYAVLAKLAGRFPRLRLIWADGGYSGQVAEFVQLTWGWTVEIVKRAAATAGFAVLPRRWVVEPGALWAGFGWFGRYRILSKDYEQLPASSEAAVLIAMIQVMLKRLEPA